MKKRFWRSLILVLIMLSLSACSSGIKQKAAPLDEAAQEVENPRESSIFEQAEVENCRVIRDGVAVRAGAGKTYDAFATLNTGDEVKVLGKIGQWYVILLDTNQVGCIEIAATTPVVKDGDMELLEPLAQRPAREQTLAPDPDQGGRAVAGLTPMESRMLELVNEERMKNQLPRLNPDLELSRVARIKSQDMVDNKYFSHYSPNYGSPFDMMKSFGIEYLYAGENLAGNSNVEGAHAGLMRSSGHRKNILNPKFTNIGLGIKPDDRYGYIFTQMFISRPE